MNVPKTGNNFNQKINIDEKNFNPGLEWTCSSFQFRIKKNFSWSSRASVKTCKCGNCDVTVRDTTDCNNLDCSTWANDPECYPN